MSVKQSENNNTVYFLILHKIIFSLSILGSLDYMKACFLSDLTLTSFCEPEVGDLYEHKQTDRQ